MRSVSAIVKRITLGAFARPRDSVRREAHQFEHSDTSRSPDGDDGSAASRGRVRRYTETPERDALGSQAVVATTTDAVQGCCRASPCALHVRGGAIVELEPIALRTLRHRAAALEGEECRRGGGYMRHRGAFASIKERGRARERFDERETGSVLRERRKRRACSIPGRSAAPH